LRWHSTAGSHLLINYRSREREAPQTPAEIQGHGGSGEPWPFAVDNPGACGQAIAACLRGHPQIDILVNNAGIRNDSLLVFMKGEQWQQVLATNLKSFFNVTQPVVKQMALNRRVRIVCIASTAAQPGVAAQAHYFAVKAGVIGASKSTARELAKRGITVNVLAPGFIETEMLNGLQRDQDQPQIPAGRFGKPEEVAEAAVFLRSGSAAYINGGAYT
jgi:3-oxoacyl-[acyl-carrier protein] reductase